MNRRTFIEWCDYTWNPWRGCTKVSPGCVNCYAEKLVVNRLGGEWGAGKPRQRASENLMRQPYSWNKRPFICNVCGNAFAHHCEQCGCDNFHRARVFLGSLMDIFDTEVPTEYLVGALMAVRDCKELDFLLVTKRPECFFTRAADAAEYLRKACLMETREWLLHWKNGEIPPNVWVITSAEDQLRLDKRVPHLMAIPAVVHGLSCEPLLEDLHLPFDKWLNPDVQLYNQTFASPGVNWVIAGGESGPGARVCEIHWLDNIRYQCRAAGVPFFMKQLGRRVWTPNANAHEWPDATAFRVPIEKMGAASAYVGLKHKKGGDPLEWPEELRVRQWPEVSR